MQRTGIRCHEPRGFEAAARRQARDARDGARCHADVTDDDGIPRMLTGHAVPAAPARTATDSARTLLERLAPAWGVRVAIPDLVGLGEVAAPAGRIARIEQVIDGMPIEGRDPRPRGEAAS